MMKLIPLTNVFTDKRIYVEMSKIIAIEEIKEGTAIVIGPNAEKDIILVKEAMKQIIDELNFIGAIKGLKNAMYGGNQC